MREARREHRREVERLRQGMARPPEVREGERARRLRATIEHARRHSPYYRRLLDGLPADPLEAFRATPVTTRADLVASALSRATPAATGERRAVWRTSGSSGEPYTFEIDGWCTVRHTAQRALVYLEAGVPRGARIAEVIAEGASEVFEDRGYPTFRRFVVNYRRVSGRLCERVADVGPTLVFGNRSHLLQIAEEARSASRRLSIPFVCSSSETLLERDKATLEEAFGCAVCEVYGSAEANNVAFYRPGEAEWTILEPRVWVEVLDGRGRPVRAGDVGEVVLTTLTEPAAPLIRYGSGDLARVADRDGNGRGGMRLAALEGRSCDAIVDQRGCRVSFWALAANGFWGRDEVASRVRRWQIHQRRDRSLRVRLELVPGAECAAVAPLIRQFLAPVVGGLPVRIESVARVHDAGPGKFRAVTSEVG
ncbi:MAG: phenylacetate--CoA ligase family protein [Pseudomonadota bacterium]